VNVIGDARAEEASVHFLIERKPGTLESVAEGRKSIDVGLHRGATGRLIRGAEEVVEVGNLLREATSFINLLQGFQGFPRIFSGIDIHELITINQQRNLGIGLRSKYNWSTDR
jgi:hypothetical protein